MLKSKQAKAEQHLADLKKQITEALTTASHTLRRAAKSLEEIREKRLYKLEVETWAEFCRNAFNISEAHANRIIQAEGQIRRLDLPPDTPLEAAAHFAKVDDDDLARTAANTALNSDGVIRLAEAKGAVANALGSKPKRPKRFKRRVFKTKHGAKVTIEATRNKSDYLAALEEAVQTLRAESSHLQVRKAA